VLEEAVTIKFVRSTVDLIAVRAVLWELAGTTRTHPCTASTLTIFPEHPGELLMSRA
jgi:hypothetical protein